MKSIEIDGNKRLSDQPHTANNRWHPEVTLALEVELGEKVVSSPGMSSTASGK